MVNFLATLLERFKRRNRGLAISKSSTVGLDILHARRALYR